MEKRRATILGATGLIGSHVLNILCGDDAYDHVKVLVRRGVQIDNPKVEVCVVDFESEPEFREAMQNAGDVFCAVGTTLKKVKGDMIAYRKVDFDIPVNAAKYCKELGCSSFAVVSSLGADSSKSNFYLKLKGEMEDKLQEIELPSLHIFRPSLLLGKRSEMRLLENVGQFILPMLSVLFPNRMKPIKAETVAHAMVNAAKIDRNQGVRVHFYRDMMNK